ncbi:MAG TPA: hypothetical protein VKU79_00050 [Thermoplasmataceae archaeon]|nr:hypothetical protein [Thermoplasmataceae archaeon]
MRWNVVIPGIVLTVLGIILGVLGFARMIPAYPWFAWGGVALIVIGLAAAGVGAYLTRKSEGASRKKQEGMAS